MSPCMEALGLNLAVAEVLKAAKQGTDRIMLGPSINYVVSVGWEEGHVLIAQVPAWNYQ